jgi:acetyl esterase/lipase
MSVSAWYLFVSIVGLLFTLVALRPPRRPEWVTAFTFFSSWLTTELAPLHLAWQLVATTLFIAFGALDSWLGWLGLACTLLSWVGLVTIVTAARRTRQAFAAGLDDALGVGWGDALDPAWKPVPHPFEWRRVLFPFSFKRRGVERVRSIQYVDGNRVRRHRLDVYRRPDAGPGAPVLLQIHGGAWVIGNKEQQGLPLMYQLAARGWVCVAANYRLAPRAPWPAQIVDCKRALAWIRTHIAEYGGDPNYVVVTGGSAGGHLAALMGLTPNDPEFQPGFEEVDTSVRAMIPFYGVYDWTNRLGQRGRRDGLRRVLERTIVKRRYSDAPEIFDRASPLSHIRADAPPALIIHGNVDSLAPVREAREFARRLRETSRNPVVYVELRGAQHAFDIFQSIRSLQTIAAVDLFLTWLLTAFPPRALVGLDDRAANDAPAAGATTDPMSTGRTAPSPAPQG